MGWKSHRKRSIMFHRKNWMHTTGLLCISSSSMTMISSRFFSITWEPNDHAQSINSQMGQDVLLLCLTMKFTCDRELLHTPAQSEEAAWPSQCRQRCGRAPRWRAADRDSSQSQQSRMCLLRRLQRESPSDQILSHSADPSYLLSWVKARKYLYSCSLLTL